MRFASSFDFLSEFTARRESWRIRARICQMWSVPTFSLLC